MSLLKAIKMSEIVLAEEASVDLSHGSGDSVLHKACRVNNLQAVECLVHSVSNVNVLNSAQSTPLHVAVEENCLEIAEVLIKSGSDVNLVNHHGDSALHIACKKNNLKMVRLLLKRGCNVNIAHKSHRTALHVASEFSSAEVVALLIQAGAVVDAVDRYGNTALMIASSVDNDRNVQQLLTNGADVNFQNNKQTAIYLASKHGYLEIIKVLIKSGVDADIRDEYGDSPLHIICKTGNDLLCTFNDHCFKNTRVNYVETLHLLIQYGCNVNAQNNNKFTPLHYALKNNCSRLAKLLLQSNADVNFVDRNGNTAIHYASKLCGAKFFRFLLEYDININAINHKRETALHIASKVKNPDIVELLLRAGGKPNDCNIRGLTPFHYACKTNSRAIVRHLIDFGFSINFYYGRRTPIIYAARNNKPDIVELLLFHGSTVDVVDEETGNSALHYACEIGSINVVEVLLKYGCVTEVKNKENLTPAVIAIRNNAFKILDMLFDYGCNIVITESMKVEGFTHIPEFLYGLFIRRNTINPYKSHKDNKYIQLLLNKENMPIHKRQCQEEVRKLREHKISHTSFTIYDMITRDFDSFLMCLKNNHVCRALQENLARKFPIYYRMIQFWYEKGLRRKTLLEKSNMVFTKLSFELPKLPSECIEIILNNLTDADLMTMIRIIFRTYTPLPYYSSLVS